MTARWISIPQAAEYTSTHPQTVRAWIRKGYIKANQLGEVKRGHWRISVESLDRFMETGIPENDSRVANAKAAIAGVG